MDLSFFTFYRNFFLLFLLFFASKALTGQVAPPENVMYIWNGDDDHAEADFITTVNFDRNSPNYGQIIKITPVEGLSSKGNEPHHIGLSPSTHTLMAGGLLSLLRGQDEIFYFDVSHPADPTYTRSFDVPIGSIADEFVNLPNGNILVTMMGGSNGADPGRIAEFDAKGDLIQEWPLVPPTKDFNPHGISVRPEVNLMVTTDFVDPVSTIVGPLDLPDLVRVWDLNKREITGTIPVPGAGGSMDIQLFPHDPLERALVPGFGGKLHLIDTKNLTASVAYDCAPHAAPVSGATTPHIVKFTKDGKRMFVTLYSSGSVLMFDSSDPANLILLDEAVIGEGSGLHYMRLSEDEKRVVVTGYFLNQSYSNAHIHGAVDTIGMVLADGDRKTHVLNVDYAAGTIVKDNRFNLDGNLAYSTGPARPHGVLFIHQPGTIPTSGLNLTNPRDITVEVSQNASKGYVYYDTPSALSTCTSGTPQVMLTQGLVSGSAFPIGSTIVSYAAADACGNEKEVTFKVTVQQVATPVDCEKVAIRVAGLHHEEHIFVSGLSSPHASVEVFNQDWLKVFSCYGSDCTIGQQLIHDLETGSYHVKVNLWDNNWNSICQKIVDVTVHQHALSDITVSALPDLTIDATSAAGVVVHYDAPTATSTCMNGAGAISIIQSSGMPSGSTFPPGVHVIEYTIKDACDNIRKITFTIRVNAMQGADCQSITFTGANNEILIGGLNAPISIIEVYDGAWNQVFRCAADCGVGTQTIRGLSAGKYFVKVGQYTQNWSLLCNREHNVELTTTPSTGDCSTVQISTANQSVQISGLSGAIALIHVFDEQWNSIYDEIVYNTAENVGTSVMAPGSYFVKVDLLDASWRPICKKEEVIDVQTAGQSNDCAALALTAEPGGVLISGISAANVLVNVFSNNWHLIESKAISSPGNTHRITGLAIGSYRIKIDLTDNAYQSICSREISMTVHQGISLGQDDNSFLAQRQNSAVQLSWLSKISAEHDYFIVERSADGQTFANLMKVQSQGALGAFVRFDKQDLQPLKGTNYYRLTLVKNDGTSWQSAVHTVYFPEITKFSVFPTPAVDNISVYLEKASVVDLNVRMIATDGRLIKEAVLPAGNTEFLFTLENVENGLYFMELSGEGVRPTTSKVVVQAD